MKFQEGVTFVEWFYNGVLTNRNLIPIIRLAHLSVLPLRWFVHGLTYFDSSWEPKTWNDKLYLVLFCFRDGQLSLAVLEFTIKVADFELRSICFCLLSGIKVMHHHLQLPDLFLAVQQRGRLRAGGAVVSSSLWEMGSEILLYCICNTMLVESGLENGLQGYFYIIYSPPPIDGSLGFSHIKYLRRHAGSPSVDLCPMWWAPLYTSSFCSVVLHAAFLF